MPSEIRFKPKHKKILELLLYLAHRKPGTDHYCASKYVYLADVAHFKRYGRPITFDVFGAMPWGPVALRTYEMLKKEQHALDGASVLELPFKTDKLENSIIISEPSRPVNYDVFSESDIEVFDSILEEFGNLRFIDLHNLTKEHFAYKKAWDNRAEGMNLVIMDHADIIDESPKKADIIDELRFTSDKI